MTKLTNLVLVLLFTAFVLTLHVYAQTPEITYQGQLDTSSAPANGNFDFEFLLFDSPAGGTQIGSTLTRNGVAVANGIFSVNLNFGGAFTGANRFLEIRVRADGGGGFTTLSPRQPVTSAPYSVKSLTADSATSAVNATNATNATTAGTATNFTGNLSGDVTGTQGATTVARLRGRTVAGTVPLGGQVLKYNGTTNQWEPDTDNTGAADGGTITGVTPGTGLTGGGATGNVTLNIANGGVNTAQLADNGVTDAKINSVSGGKVTGAVANATNAATSTNFTGTLSGDVTGSQGATVVATVGGNSAANVGAAVQSINSATSINTPNTLVRRDGSGNFAAGSITGNLTGNASTATNATTATNAENATNATNALSLGGVAANQYLQTNGNGSGLTNLNASSITTGTLANARLGQIPTANIADNAVTSPKIASGQVVKNLNGMTDNVTLAQGANITITPSGNTLTIASTGGGSAILNQTTQQAGANFNISGNGTAAGTLSAEVVNAATQFNQNGSRILAASGTSNLFAGLAAGAVNTSGARNSFFGDSAGAANTVTNNNSFFGASAGAENRANNNSFFGGFAGGSNTMGLNNAFFGNNAGANNVLGFNNAIFGSFAGSSLTGSRNSVFGATAGASTSGNSNSFFGENSGSGSFAVTGNQNTAIGANAVFGATGVINATLIGASAITSQSNALILGSVAGMNGATASVNVGIGTTTPASRLDIVATGDGAELLRLSTERPWVFRQASGGSNAALRLQPFAGQKNFEITAAGNTPVATFFGDDASPRVSIGTNASPATLTVRGPGPIDILRVENTSGLSGLVVRNDRIVAIGLLSSLEEASMHVCVDSVNRLSFCTSSLRYKQQVGPYIGGLDLIRRLRPISFTWKGNGTTDLGLAAEEVAAVEPLLVTHNTQGEIQGVKYDQVSVVLINAVKEQQRLIKSQQRQIDQLKKIVCVRNRKAGICKKETK